MTKKATVSKGEHMRKLFLVISLILGMSAFSFAQEPIQVGWAVITPTSATTTGLVVFQTFGFTRALNDTNQAGVLPSSLTTNAIVFVSASTRLNRNVGVAFVNPQSSAVAVTLTLRRDDGTVFATSVTVNVPAMQQVSKFVSEQFLGLPTDFVGTLSVTAPSPIAVVGLRFRGANFSTIPITNVSPAAVPTIAIGIGGPGAVLLPQFAIGGGWATEIVIANTGTSSQTVRVDLFNAGGTPFPTTLNNQTSSSFTSLTILAGGVLVMAPRNTQGDSVF
jgi:hypothetical protein